MTIGKKALMYVTPVDPKTKKSLGSFTVYKNKVKTKKEALKRMKESLE